MTPLKPNFRHLLQVSDRTKVLDILRDIHGSDDFREGYEKVMDTLLAFSHPMEWSRHSWLLSYIPVDEHNDEAYINVSLLNHEYVEPAADLKPYYGARGKPVPEGYYDAEKDCHQPVFAVGFTDWASLMYIGVWLDPEDKVRELCPTTEHMVANILWELTFYSFDEAGMRKIRDELMGAIEAYFEEKETRLSIVGGKCVHCGTVQTEALQCSGCGWVDPLTKLS